MVSPYEIILIHRNNLANWYTFQKWGLYLTDEHYLSSGFIVIVD